MIPANPVVRYYVVLIFCPPSININILSGSIYRFVVYQLHKL